MQTPPFPIIEAEEPPDSTGTTEEEKRANKEEEWRSATIETCIGSGHQIHVVIYGGMVGSIIWFG